MIKENFEILGFWSSIFKEKICDGTTIFQELLKVLALKKDYWNNLRTLIC